ncbi:bactericidal permeability-increasing protein-like [Strongylocentrotus purpuratus]|uniref:Bactericidal permeability-increasing protein n=1 Tax=Strongylocentrotus purpuratus TaxID=7668 RepID=A0A7M7N6X2_STRPU|nr:bactericidal permeability-increasing protein-like [Strongylocentrotus purpuratus]
MVRSGVGSNMFSGSSMSPILAGFLVVCCVLGSSANRNVYRKVGPYKWKLNGWNKEPGFKARISQKGLDFLRDVGIQMLQKQIQQLTIPDIHGSADIGIGDVKYDVTNIRITTFSIPTASLTPDPAAGGLTLKTSGINLKVHGDWHYKIGGFIPISDSGNFDASASSISLAVTLRIGVDATGRPNISSKALDCSFNIGGLDVDLHGGASWLYNLFDDKIGDAIKDSLNGQICDTVIDEVNGSLEDELKDLQVIAPVGDVVEIDYSLVESPSFNGSINTAHKGEVYPIGNTTECPLPVPQIPPDSDISRMVFIWITEYLPNSAGYALQNVGFLQYNVTPENVPAEEKNYLNTSNFALDLLIPQINKMYPNMAMQINVNSTKAPVVKVASTGVQAVLVGDFIPYAILPNKTLAYLFTLSVTISAKVSVNFTGNNITWNISSFSTTMKAVHSAVGPFFTSALQLAVNTAIKVDLIPDLNKLGAVGAPLPQLDGFNFTKPVVSLGEGFLKIGTDLTYTP